MSRRLAARAAVAFGASFGASLGISVGAGLLAAPALAQKAPYAGQEARGIAALSEADVAALRAGEGQGFAKVAELNGYPGPAHLLEHAEALGLTVEQRQAVQASFDAMNADARALGADLIAAEARLDAGFEAGDLDRAAMDALVAEAAEAEGRLRARHLAAHLEVTPLLAPEQVAAYGRLRGYGGAEGGKAAGSGADAMARHGDH